MVSMAENWFHDGESSEFFISVILSPDTILMLFLDGSSVLESSRSFTLFESCWN